MGILSRLMTQGADPKMVTANGGGRAAEPETASTVFGGFKVPPFAEDSPALKRFQEIQSERGRLQEAEREQRDAIARLRQEIDELDRDRVERIADALSQGASQDDWEAIASPNASAKAIASAPVPMQRARDILLSIELKRQALADAERLVEIFAQRSAAFDEERQTLRLQLSVEVGKLLDGMFQAIAETYNASAIQTAELLVQLAAVQETMMFLHTGNSNGWERNGLLPHVVHDARHIIPPFLDCAAGDLRQRTQPYRERILDDLERIGYSQEVVR